MKSVVIEADFKVRKDDQSLCHQKVILRSDLTVRLRHASSANLMNYGMQNYFKD